MGDNQNSRTQNLVTDKQVRRLFALGKVEGNLETAAAKAGMDAKTARKYRRLGRVPSELKSGVKVADAGGLLSGGLGRSAKPAGGEPWTGSEDDLLSICSGVMQGDLPMGSCARYSDARNDRSKKWNGVYAWIIVQNAGSATYPIQRGYKPNN